MLEAYLFKISITCDEEELNYLCEMSRWDDSLTDEEKEQIDKAGSDRYWKIVG